MYENVYACMHACMHVWPRSEAWLQPVLHSITFKARVTGVFAPSTSGRIPWLGHDRSPQDNQGLGEAQHLSPAGQTWVTKRVHAKNVGSTHGFDVHYVHGHMGSIFTMYIDIHFVKEHSPRAYPPKLVNLTSVKVRVPPMVGRRFAAAGGERRCWAPRAGSCRREGPTKGFASQQFCKNDVYRPLPACQLRRLQRGGL